MRYSKISQQQRESENEIKERKRVSYTIDKVVADAGLSSAAGSCDESCSSAGLCYTAYLRGLPALFPLEHLAGRDIVVVFCPGADNRHLLQYARNSQQRNDADRNDTPATTGGNDR